MSLNRIFFLLTVVLAVLSSAAPAAAQANTIFHQRTNTPIASGKENYVDILNPGFTDAEVVRWKIYYNTFTNHASLYYTTDGSNPGGSFGVGTGTTQVITATYIDIFTDPSTGQYVDIIQAIIPAQPPGTTVKYLVSGWKTISSFTLPEYFADGGTCPTCAPTTNSASGTVFSYVVPAPAITGISPSSGPPGASVNITGTNFGATQATGNSTVSFNGANAGTATVWTPTGITVNVPANATTGNVIVTVDGVPSGGAPFIVTNPPTISIAPNSGAIGGRVPVTITGTNFTAGASVTVSDPAITPMAVTVVSPTKITAALMIGANALHGVSNVTVTTTGGTTAPAPFTSVSAPPFITSLAPGATSAGSLVTITGNNFGAMTGTVTFNGTAASVFSWGPTTIVAYVPNGATSGNIVVTANGLSSSGTPFTVLPVVSIASVTPTSASAGTAITISGSGFGASQAGGTVWLGSTYGTVVSWSNTQVIAVVASGSSSGIARVQQGGVKSNSVPFSVINAVVSLVVPANAAPGAQVTITGTGFGASQGSGQVWLGTAYGVVQSWSNTQIIAQIAAGSYSGKAQVLQNGVWSNAVPISVDALHITGVSPTTGAAGTLVTITGSGFGATQGTSTVTLGSLPGLVSSWSDTQILASVAAGSLTGDVRVQIVSNSGSSQLVALARQTPSAGGQTASWSNPLPFTVPSGNSVTLVPYVLNMLVGDNHSIQAINSAGNPVTGLTWTSSDPTVVSLSTDNPPTLTALAVGRVTITAGSASTDVTVSVVDPSTGSLPIGTLLWSNPAPGVNAIVPAVPSPTGVADVFAYENNYSTVQAITTDGTTAWTAAANRSFVPDFQGGMVGVSDDGTAVLRLDGLTGQRSTVYTSSNTAGKPIPHTDGTIFAMTGDYLNGSASVVGIDPAGGVKFSVPVPYPTDGFGCVMGINPIIAGDGYYYVPYEWETFLGIGAFHHLGLLRVNSSGASDDITVMEADGWLGEICGFSGGMITNADQGVVLTFSDELNIQHMALVTGTSVSLTDAPTLPAGGLVLPVLQAQDGSFVGSGTDNDGTQYMAAFDQTGSVRWIVANEQPQIATGDGGVIAGAREGNSAIVLDKNGSVTGQIGSLPTYSWTRGYQQGSVDLVMWPLIIWPTSLWSTWNGNPSGNLAAASLMPSGAQFNEARGYMPGVLANAINAVQTRPDCAAIFGTAASRANGFDPATVLSALYTNIGVVNFQSVTRVGGKPVSSAFVYHWMVGIPYFLEGEAQEDTVLYIGPGVLGFGPRVKINVDIWNSEGRNLATRSMTLTLLHEMGHVFNSLRSQGSGGSQILEPDAYNGRGHANDVLILGTCLPL